MCLANLEHFVPVIALPLGQVNPERHIAAARLLGSAADYLRKMPPGIVAVHGADEPSSTFTVAIGRFFFEN